MVTTIEGQLVLEDRVAGGRLTVDGGVIDSIVLDDTVSRDASIISPGFVDIHVHGWGGHDAMSGRAALDGMARALLPHGVTSFLPTAVSAPLEKLHEFANTVREWLPEAPADGAQPLGFNLEGPFLAEARRGAHDPAVLQLPAKVPLAQIESLVEGLRVITIAPELPGAVELIRWLNERGVAVSLGHSAATLAQAVAGYMAGAKTTTHLFNAMTGIEHRAPGLAVAALLNDDAYAELICDGIHVDRALWPIVVRVKPTYRLLLVTDAIYLAGTGNGQGSVGGLAVEVKDGRVTLAGTSTLAGSVLSLDVAVRNLAGSGVALPAAVAAASRNPLALLGMSERGRFEPGQPADLVELDADLNVKRVMRAGAWAYQA